MVVRLLLLLATLVSMATLPRVSVVAQWDESAVAWLAQLRMPTLNAVFEFVTKLGETAPFLLALLVGALYFLQRRRRLQAVFFVAGIGLVKLGQIPLKLWIARPRPALAMFPMSTFSMPSGHAINAVLIFGLLGVFSLQKISSPSARVFVFFTCLVTAFAVGFSRIYLGVHYPSDVLLGMLYAAAGLWALQGCKKDLFVF